MTIGQWVDNAGFWWCVGVGGVVGAVIALLWPVDR